MTQIEKTITSAALALAVLAFPLSGAENTAPVVKHQPVSVGVQGQPISVRATVSDDTAVKAVTLFYSTSKDVAPFKLQMQAAGSGLYVCTIPANLISRAAQVSYYIEALDDIDTASETPWYVVKLQAPGATAATGAAGATGTGGTEPEKKSSWKTPALIAGGTLLLAGGAYAISEYSKSDNDDDSSSTSTDTNGTSTTDNPYAGTYSGSMTRYLQFPDRTTTESHSITITIGASGAVSTDTLQEDASMSDSLSSSSDNTFSMSASVSESNYTGQVFYYGTIYDNGTIDGSIGGSVQTTTGTNATFDGSFSASR